MPRPFWLAKCLSLDEARRPDQTLVRHEKEKEKKKKKRGFFLFFELCFWLRQTLNKEENGTGHIVQHTQRKRV